MVQPKLINCRLNGGHTPLHPAARTTPPKFHTFLLFAAFLACQFCLIVKGTKTPGLDRARSRMMNISRWQKTCAPNSTRWLASLMQKSVAYQHPGIMPADRRCMRGALCSWNNLGKLWLTAATATPNTKDTAAY